MRLRHPDGTVVHVAYCVNVPTATDVDGVVRLLDRYAEPVRERLDLDRLGLGLWLAADVVAGLVDNPAALGRLRAALAVRGLDVITMNAVPYGEFDQPVIKAAGYLPDWTDPRRLVHTLSCARLLTELLPDNVVWGSVATVPLAWRTPWTPARSATAHRALHNLADGLAELHWSTGRRVRVGLTPEPGCVIGTAEQAVTELSTVDNEWIGVSLDTCHLAVTFEQPATAVARLAAAYVPIVKAQVSCAVQSDDPAVLAGLAESRFLRQTTAFVGGRRRDADDLPDALAGGLPPGQPWRVHVHLPVHAQPPSGTAAVTTDSLAALFDPSGARTDHVEVATYTGSWTPDLIAAELAWTRDRLIAVGLKDEEST
ncbi:MAG TPA: metabolite traffic protein EboE [Pseudonocardiaceae bacterium]